jgi:hypothetical protein
MKKHILIAVGLAVGILGAAIALGVIRKQPGGVSRDQKPAPPASMREKARQKRHYVGTISPAETTRYDDVENLTTGSTLVVTGIVQQQNSFVPASNERLIVTAHQVLVQQVLKGGVHTGDSKSIETLGGKVDFEDGSVAELKQPDIFKDPELGRTYVFFLRPHKAAYRLVGGPQGLFEIKPNGKISPQVPANDQLMKYNKKSASEFLQTIRQSPK